MSKQLKRVCVCGHFAFGKNLLNGQTVKTQIIYNELLKKLGDTAVSAIDTHGGKKKYLSLPFCILKELRRCKNIIILPAHNGIRVIAPLLVIENLFFKRTLHYCVIGGWLPGFLKNKKFLTNCLKKFSTVFVETSSMQKKLTDMGFGNIVLMPNCKELNILSEADMIVTKEEPFALCTFSRVMKEKGIEDAINAVKEINTKYKRTVYTLDIYGQVDDKQENWFNTLLADLPDYIRYKGKIDFDKSTQVLKNYFLLLFPTHYYTEGIPGTIIDAYSAGIPVVCSEWENCFDIVEKDQSGLTYKFDDTSDFVSVLEKAACEPDTVNAMKNRCLSKASDFCADTVIKSYFFESATGLK